MIETSVSQRAERARELGAPMVALTVAERRAHVETTLRSPPRRYGFDAKAIFWLEDRVWGAERSFAKFKAQELVARSPYRAWQREHDDPADDVREAHNEMSHWNVLRHLIGEDGARDNGVRFGALPALGAVGMFAFTLVQHHLSPRSSHRLNADIEDHAEHEYASFVAEHPEWEARHYDAVVAEYGSYESRNDLLRQISCDEHAHKERSIRLAGG